MFVKDIKINQDDFVTAAEKYFGGGSKEKTYKVEYLHITGQQVYKTHSLSELIDKLDELETDKHVTNESIKISTIEA